MATNFMTSSEGAIAGLYTGISDLAPAGDTRTFHRCMIAQYTLWHFHYLPTEDSSRHRRSRKARHHFARVSSLTRTPARQTHAGQLECIFGAERTGGWQLGESDLAKAKQETIFSIRRSMRAVRKTNIRTWGQLGLTGDWANKEIQTYGYIAQASRSILAQAAHWSDKWKSQLQEYVEAKEAPADAEWSAVASERMLRELSRDKYGSVGAHSYTLKTIKCETDRPGFR